MLAYLLCFSITLAFAWCNERLLEKPNNDKRLVAITAVAVILMPAILAGVRDNIIGTDIYFYTDNVFTTVQKFGRSVVIDPATYKLERIERGFLAYGYLATLLFPTLNGFLFMISVFINGCVYWALYNMRASCSIFVGEWVFLFTCYNESYNLMRQYMAMGLILVALSYCLKKSYLKTLPFLILACIFHRSAVIGFFILILTGCMEININSILPKKLNNNILVKVVLFTVLCCLLSLFFRPVCVTLINHGLIAKQYLGYVKPNVHGQIVIKHFVLYVLGYVILFAQYKRLRYAGAFLAFAMCDMLFYPLRTYLFWLYRISTYFLFLRILAFSQFKFDWQLLLQKKKLDYIDLWTLGILLTTVIFWGYFMIHKGYNETYPYLSTILGIVG